MNRKIAALIFLQAVGIAAYVALSRKHPDRPFFYESLSGPFAPDLEIERSDGSRQLLSAHGRPLVVHFWASWCKPCIEELPQILDLAEQVPILAISLDAGWSEIERVTGGRKSPTLLRAVSSTRAVELWNLSTLPDTYYVDRNGHIGARALGARDWRSKSARDFVSGR